MITINNTPFFWEKAYNRGLCYIKDLYDGNGQIKSIRQIREQFGLDVMSYNSLVSAIPILLRRKYALKYQSEPLGEPLYVIDSRKQYEAAVTDTEHICFKKKQWELEVNHDIDMSTFTTCFLDVFRVTNIPKYRSFQYQLLHRAVITNVHLAHWGLKSSNMCSFCGLFKETYTHLFVMCDHVKELWLYIEQYMNKISKEPLSFDVDTVMVNRIVPDDPYHVKNYVCLITKQYIYRQRCLGKNLNPPELKSLLIETQNIEKYIAVKNNKENRYESKWNPDFRPECPSNVTDPPTNYVHQYIMENM